MSIKIVGMALTLLAAATAAPFAPRGFVFTGLTNRFVTPNGDGKNDRAVFQFQNPRDSGGTIRIFDVHGRQVEQLEITVNATSVEWDPRGVSSGVYLFVVTVDDIRNSGTLVVLR
ncbi:MAG: gliding motility-associated C-terminal domain-containing protein [Elusimicrobiota bacterium]